MTYLQTFTHRTSTHHPHNLHNPHTTTTESIGGFWSGAHTYIQTDRQLSTPRQLSQHDIGLVTPSLYYIPRPHNNFVTHRKHTRQNDVNK